MLSTFSRIAVDCSKVREQSFLVRQTTGKGCEDETMLSHDQFRPNTKVRGYSANDIRVKILRGEFGCREKEQEKHQVQQRSIVGDILCVAKNTKSKKREGMIMDHSVVLKCDTAGKSERCEERHLVIPSCTPPSNEFSIAKIHSGKLLLGRVFFPTDSYASEKRNL